MMLPGNGGNRCATMHNTFFCLKVLLRNISQEAVISTAASTNKVRFNEVIYEKSLLGVLHLIQKFLWNATNVFCLVVSGVHLNKNFHLIT